jgi:hypothetical protein
MTRLAWGRALGGIAAELGLQFDQIGEDIGLAPQLVGDHRRLARDRGDHGHPDAAALHRFDQRAEIAVASQLSLAEREGLASSLTGALCLQYVTPHIPVHRPPRKAFRRIAADNPRFSAVRRRALPDSRLTRFLLFRRFQFFALQATGAVAARSFRDPIQFR